MEEVPHAEKPVLKTRTGPAKNSKNIKKDRRKRLATSTFLHDEAPAKDNSKIPQKPPKPRQKVVTFQWVEEQEEEN